MNRIQSIQYLRGLAAVMVVILHTPPSHTGPLGAAGVDIFFVISGFIMWAVINRRAITPSEFIHNRIARVVPLYWIATFIVSAAAVAAPAAFAHLKLTPEHFALSLLFIPHIDLSNGLISPVVVPGWTLNYEAFFYAIVALSLTFAASKRLFFIAFWLTTLPLAGRLIGGDATIVKFCGNPVLLEFLSGVLICVAWRGDRLPGKTTAYALVAAAVAGFAATSVLGPEAEDYRVLIWGVPATMLVLGVLALEQHTGPWSFPALGLIGDASYSIYLSHSLTISVVRKAADVAAHDPVYAFPPALTVATMAACVLAGIAVYRFVETPLLRAFHTPASGPQGAALAQK